jgi:hypothetical protein
MSAPRAKIAPRPRAWLLLALVLAVAAPGCAVVRPWQRERLAGPAMQFQMAPYADGQESSVTEITEGGTFPSAGPGNAGAGCGCH